MHINRPHQVRAGESFGKHPALSCFSKDSASSLSLSKAPKGFQQSIIERQVTAHPIYFKAIQGVLHPLPVCTLVHLTLKNATHHSIYTWHVWLEHFLHDLACIFPSEQKTDSRKLRLQQTETQRTNITPVRPMYAHLPAQSD